MNKLLRRKIALNTGNVINQTTDTIICNKHYNRTLQAHEPINTLLGFNKSSGISVTQKLFPENCLCDFTRASKRIPIFREKIKK